MADQEGLDEIKLEPYEAPGWDVGGGTDGEEGDGHSQETLKIGRRHGEQHESVKCASDIINVTQSYNCSSLVQNNSVLLSTLTPIPSQTIDSIFNNVVLTITLDSGATLSFIRLDVALKLGLTIRPNGQLAILADEKTRMISKGEIDITVVINGKIALRLRALVMEQLQSDCFGGTNFHKDNGISANIETGNIKLHGGSSAINNQILC